MEAGSYEDGFGPVGRRLARVGRGLRWWAKGVAGRPRRILVETRWRLGDEVMALPILGALREAWPGAGVHVLSNYPALFEGNPHVTTVNEPPGQPDRYVLLRGVDRRRHRLACYAEKAGVAVPAERPRLFFEDWAGPQLDVLAPESTPLVGMAAGASWPTKRWRPERWLDLAHRVEACGARVVELGHGHEAVGAGHNLVDQTTVREAACVLHHCAALVCCDSGLMHLALAAGTPVVALFGPTVPDILVRNDPDFHPVASPVPCQGHWNRDAAPPEHGECPRGQARCLDTIEVNAVFERVCAVLGMAGQ